MSEAVLDSSALLALLWNEPGADVVANVLPDALISSVNFAEALAKLIEVGGLDAGQARASVERVGVRVVDFDADQAEAAAALREPTRSLGLSLGDRACLALAKHRDCPALTADTAWAKVPGFQVRLVRTPAVR